MFAKSLSNLFAKTKNIGNTRSHINQWDLPDEFKPNGESLSSKTCKLGKYENTKQ